MKPNEALLRLVIPLPAPAPDWPCVSLSASIREVAILLSDLGADGVIVHENNRATGVILTSHLLEELSFDRDPVSGLPRSGPLRDWLAARLREGFEVAVTFIDLDRFAEINREKGHTEGDAALGRAAAIIRDAASDSDFVSRFGGDEFVIGTIRSRPALEGLAERIRSSLAADGLPATVGLAGGRRDKAREDDSIHSTVEELLRLASLDCVSKKRPRDPERS